MRGIRKLPPAEVLWEKYDYNPETGILISRWTGAPIRGGSKGYLMVMVLGEAHLAHRIIWKMQTGEDPPDLIDHKNLNKKDNGWENLRSSLNGQNRANSLGNFGHTVPKGVIARRVRRFQAFGKLNWKTIFLGTYDTAEEAHQAYVRHARAVYGEFFNPGDHLGDEKSE